MPRPHEFSSKVKVAAFQRCGGRCEACTAALRPGGFQYDHRTPVAMGGASALDNCEVLCSSCHGAKTAGSDIPAIAKSNRVRRNHIGAKAPSRNPLPGGRGSQWKKTFSNGWVKR